MTEAEKREAANAARRARYAADPQKAKDAARRWRQANPEKVRAASRSRYARGGAEARLTRQLQKYRLPRAEYEAMLTAQNGCCAACGEPFQDVGNRRSTFSIHIDHDHATGRVRGLLHHTCNITAGFIEKNLDRALAVTAYLLRSTEQALDNDWPAD